MSTSSLTPELIQQYKDHASDDRAPNVIAAITCGLVLGYTAVAIRVYTRLHSALKLGIDDWLIIFALIPQTLFVGCVALAIRFGLGKHVIFVSSTKGFIMTFLVGIAAYATTTVFIKSSVLCFYNRIFPSKALWRLSIGLMVIILSYSITLTFVAFFECIPLSTLWTFEPGKCINTLPPYLATAIANLVTDVFILTIPIRFVLNLHMKLVRKIQILGIFLLGSLVCVFGLIRTIEVSHAPPVDISYSTVYTAIWSCSEISVGIVAACLPTYGVLFAKAKPTPSYGTPRSRSTGRLGLGNSWGKINNSLPKNRLYDTDIALTTIEDTTQTQTWEPEHTRDNSDERPPA